MNQKTIANTLNSLEKQNIVKFSTEGRNKYYILNENYLHLEEEKKKKLIEDKK